MSIPGPLLTPSVRAELVLLVRSSIGDRNLQQFSDRFFHGEQCQFTIGELLLVNPHVVNRTLELMAGIASSTQPQRALIAKALNQGVEFDVDRLPLTVKENLNALGQVQTVVTPRTATAAAATSQLPK